MPIYDYQIVDPLGPQPDQRLTDLAVMGVPPKYWDGFPVPDAYPIKFSADAKPVWDAMLMSDEYLLKMRNQTADAAWLNAIGLFLDLCTDFGVVPFAGNTDTVKNETVMSALRSQRIRLVAYMNRMELFTTLGLQVRKSYREYVRTSTGFIVSSWADLFPYTLKDRPELEAYINSQELHHRDRMLRYLDNHFVNQIWPGLQVWFKSLQPLRLQIGFTINIEGTVNIPGNKTPTRKEVDAFLDRQFWFPLLRQHRIDGVVTRLF